MADIQFRYVGASNHTDKERVKEDYYATDPAAIDYLLSGGHSYHIIYGNVLVVKGI